MFIKKEFFIFLLFAILLILHSTLSALEKVIKKGESQIIEGLEIRLPEDGIMVFENRVSSPIRIYPFKGDDFIIIIRKNKEKLDQLKIADLKNSFLPGGKYEKETMISSEPGRQVMKYSGEFQRIGNNLRSILYLFEKNTIFYSVWITYRKERNDLENYFSVHTFMK